MKWYLIIVALSAPTEPKTLRYGEAFETLEQCESSITFQHYHPPLEGLGTICLPWPRKAAPE